MRQLYPRLPTFSWTINLFYSEYEGGKLLPIQPQDEDIKVILKERTRASLCFKLEINIPLAFIPLIRSISCQMETDRGDIQPLVWADFAYNPTTRNVEDWATTKIDQGYRNRPYARVNLKNFKLDYEKSLIEHVQEESHSSNYKCLQAIMVNFKVPVLPTIRLQVGKKSAEIAKITEVLMPKLVVINTIQTIVASVATIIPGLFWPMVTYAAFGCIIFIMIIQYYINRAKK
jgi:hypothetical protein